MTHLTRYMKWFCRASLLLLATAMSYVVTRTSYNFAHWVPHNHLKELGLSYSTILSAEQNADIILHFVGALLLTLLIRFSVLPVTRQSALRALTCVVGLCCLAEAVQWQIGRGLETSDLLLGIMGSFVAYLAINKN